MATEKKIRLTFNSAQVDDNSVRVAVFASQEQKEKYTELENSHCSNAYWKIGAARTAEERERFKELLDNARWNFYQQYINSESLKEASI